MSQAAPAAASTPGASLLPDSTELFTIGHLAIVALFALAAIAVIVWGMRLKRARRTADRDIAEHNHELAAETPAEPRAVREPSAAAPPATTPAMPPPPMIDPDVVPLGPTPTPAVAGVGLAAGPADGPVTQLKGLGPKVAQRLAELGITNVGQVAALTDDEAAALDAKLGAFGGRMARDRWLEQARFLAAGDKAGFEAVFGRL